MSTPRPFRLTMMEAVCDRLVLTREAMDMTQAEFGRFTGIGPQAWNNYEQRVNLISLEEALKVCAATGVSLDWIYRGDKSNLPHHLAVKIQKLQGDAGKKRA